MVSEITWGGSGIEKVVFDFICERVPIGSIVIELGAGYVSTLALRDRYKLYSVDHNSEFVNLFQNVNYIYAPEVNGWYDMGIMYWRLPIPREQQKLVLIDGLNRSSILQHLHLFNPDALFIVHDTNRSQESDLALELARRLKRPVTFYFEGDNWAAI